MNKPCGSTLRPQACASAGLSRPAQHRKATHAHPASGLLSGSCCCSKRAPEKLATGVGGHTRTQGLEARTGSEQHRGQSAALLRWSREGATRKGRGRVSVCARMIGGCTWCGGAVKVKVCRGGGCLRESAQRASLVCCWASQRSACVLKWWRCRRRPAQVCLGWPHHHCEAGVMLHHATDNAAATSLTAALTHSRLHPPQHTPAIAHARR